MPRAGAVEEIGPAVAVDVADGQRVALDAAADAVRAEADLRRDVLEPAWAGRAGLAGLGGPAAVRPCPCCGRGAGRGSRCRAGCRACRRRRSRSRRRRSGCSPASCGSRWLSSRKLPLPRLVNSFGPVGVARSRSGLPSPL